MSRDAAPSGRSLHLFACATAAAAFLVVVAGALVTSTGSGLAVPDWPLAFGKFFPRMRGGVLFEHGHRLVAGTAALLTWTLAAWVLRDERRRPVRTLAVLAAGGILLQALLGGLTVLFKLPPQASVSHACLAQAVFCLLLAVAQTTSPRYLAASRAAASSAGWRIGGAAAAAAYLQLVFGAVLRHTGRGLPLHAAWAVPVSLLAAWTSVSGWRSGERELAWPSAAIAVLLAVQLGLGVSSFLVRFSAIDFTFSQSVAVTTAHLAVGALLLGAAVIWTVRARRFAGAA